MAGRAVGLLEALGGRPSQSEPGACLATLDRYLTKTSTTMTEVPLIRWFCPET
jgi:hypothetical protein